MFWKSLVCRRRRRKGNRIYIFTFSFILPNKIRVRRSCSPSFLIYLAKSNEKKNNLSLLSFFPSFTLHYSSYLISIHWLLSLSLSPHSFFLLTSDQIRQPGCVLLQYGISSTQVTQIKGSGRMAPEFSFLLDVCPIRGRVISLIWIWIYIYCGFCAGWLVVWSSLYWPK